MAGSGYGVGIGRFVNGATAENPQFACAWPARFEDSVQAAGDMDVDGALHVQGDIQGVYMRYSPVEADTGMRWYNGEAIYCRVCTGTSLTNNGGTDVGTITGINALVAVQGLSLIHI